MTDDHDDTHFIEIRIGGNAEQAERFFEDLIEYVGVIAPGEEFFASMTPVVDTPV